MQDGAPTRDVDFDRLGRELRVNERLHDGGIRYADKRYSARGLLARESDFLRSGESQSWTSYDSYDLLGRLTQKTVPKQLADVGGVNHGDLRTSYSYSGRKTRITLRGTASSFPSSKELTLERSADSLGRFLVSKDAAGGISKYWYDAHGNAIAIKDAQGVVTRASYNASGQRTAVADPNQGSSSFSYNALGELLSETDARGITTTHLYDKLGRRTQRSAQSQADPSRTGLVSVVDEYFYDVGFGKGLPSGHRRLLDGVTEREVSLVYDEYSRLHERYTSQRVGGNSYRNYLHRWRYDGYYGRPTAEAWPNGVARQLLYSKYGHLIEERNPRNQAPYRKAGAVNGRGQLTTETLGAITAHYGSKGSGLVT